MADKENTELCENISDAAVSREPQKRLSRREELELWRAKKAAEKAAKAASKQTKESRKESILEPTTKRLSLPVTPSSAIKPSRIPTLTPARIYNESTSVSGSFSVSAPLNAPSTPAPACLTPLQSVDAKTPGGKSREEMLAEWKRQKELKKQEKAKAEEHAREVHNSLVFSTPSVVAVEPAPAPQRTPLRRRAKQSKPATDSSLPPEPVSTSSSTETLPSTVPASESDNFTDIADSSTSQKERLKQDLRFAVECIHRGDIDAARDIFHAMFLGNARAKRSVKFWKAWADLEMQYGVAEDVIRLYNEAAKHLRSEKLLNCLAVYLVTLAVSQRPTVVAPNSDDVSIPRGHTPHDDIVSLMEEPKFDTHGDNAAGHDHAEATDMKPAENISVSTDTVDTPSPSPTAVAEPSTFHETKDHTAATPVNPTAAIAESTASVDSFSTPPAAAITPDATAPVSTSSTTPPLHVDTASSTAASTNPSQSGPSLSTTPSRFRHKGRESLTPFAETIRSLLVREKQQKAAMDAEMVGSEVVMVTVRASKRERDRLGSDCVLTPVRRSSRVSHGHPGVDMSTALADRTERVKLLEEAHFAFSPNIAVQRRLPFDMRPLPAASVVDLTLGSVKTEPAEQPSESGQQSDISVKTEPSDVDAPKSAKKTPSRRRKKQTVEDSPNGTSEYSVYARLSRHPEEAEYGRYEALAPVNLPAKTEAGADDEAPKTQKKTPLKRRVSGQQETSQSPVAVTPVRRSRRLSQLAEDVPSGRRIVVIPNPVVDMPPPAVRTPLRLLRKNLKEASGETQADGDTHDQNK